MDAPCATVQIRVAQLPLLEERQQGGFVELQVDGRQPGAQQRAGVVGAEVGADLTAAHLAFTHHALDDLQHRPGAGRLGPVVAAEAADRQGHRSVGPLRRAALLSVRRDVAAPHVGQELGRVGGPRGLGERATDIDSGVVI